MRLYQRYLTKEVSAAVVLVLCAFLALFGFFDFVAEVKGVGVEGYGLQQAATVVALRLPGRAYELMPLAVLIGTLYALSTLARHSEITVLRASGVSTLRLLANLMRVAISFAVLTFVLGEFVVPVAEQSALSVLAKSQGKSSVRTLKSGVWLKDGRTFINIQEVASDLTLDGVRIYDFDASAHLRAVIEAASGVVEVPGQWKLLGVVSTELAGTKAVVKKQDSMQWQSAISPNILSVLTVAPDKMSLFRLSAYIQHLVENHQKTQRYEIALWKKVVYPLAALVMVALALPFGYTHSRVSGVSFKIFAGVMIGVTFHMLNGLFSNLGVINSWSPALSAATPSALFLFVAAVMIWWVERR